MDSGFTYFRGYQFFYKTEIEYDNVLVQSRIDSFDMISQAVIAIDELNERIVNLENETRLLRTQLNDQLGIPISD